MLKHTSNNTAGSGVSNGQLRNASNLPQRSNTNTNHMRPQHPLNVSTFSHSSSLQTPITSLNTCGSNLANYGTTERMNTTLGLLDINSSSPNLQPPNFITNSHCTNTTMANDSPNFQLNVTRSANQKPHHLHTYCNQQNLTGATNQTNASEPCYSNFNNRTTAGVCFNKSLRNGHGPAPQEALTSLGLLCLVSLLLAILSLIFLLKISPNGREEALQRSPNDDFVVIYDITLALCALSLSLNLCCLLVCAIQFLFAVKLLRSSTSFEKENKYLEKSRLTRTCAIGGFFISIPVFLTGIILYTFNQFHSTPAIITSILIGIGIVFCGGAMVHNVFVWQKEKTICYKSAAAVAANATSSSHLGTCQPIHFITPKHHINLNSANSPVPQAVSNPTSPLVNGTLLIRPSTATPPTPKPIVTNNCETSRSVSPGLLPVLDMSNITISAHELSTLV